MTGRHLAAGLHGFDDLQIGDLVETGSVVVTAAMIDTFADLTGDRFAIHMTDTGAQALGFARRVAHGLLVLSLIDGLKNQCPAQLRAVASLGWDWSFRKPVLLDDRLRAVMSVAAKRPTSNAARGIVTLSFQVLNQSGDVVQLGQNQLMMLRQSVIAPGF